MNIHTLTRPFLRWRRPTLSDKAIGGVALGISTLSGSTFAAYSKQLRGSMSSLSLLFVSELLTGFFVIFSFGFVPVLKEIVHLNKKKMQWLFVMAMFSGVLGPLLWFMSLTYTTAVNASFISKAQLIFVIVLARLILKEEFTRSHFAAICSVFVGILIITFQGMTTGFALHLGDTLVIASVICYALGNIVYRAKLHGIECHLALLGRSIIAVSVFFVASPFIEHPFIMEMMVLPTTLIPALIAFAFVGRFLNSVTYFVAVDRLPLITISLIGTLDIIGSTVFAFLYLGEPIEWYHYLGGAFIILGNILLELVGAHPSNKHMEQHLRQKAM